MTEQTTLPKYTVKSACLDLRIEKFPMKRGKRKLTKNEKYNFVHHRETINENDLENSIAKSLPQRIKEAKEFISQNSELVKEIALILYFKIGRDEKKAKCLPYDLAIFVEESEMDSLGEHVPHFYSVAVDRTLREKNGELEVTT